MRIECPTCSIGFNVSDDQVGQKGLCPKCETKFIIPAEQGDEIEILAEGKAVAEEKAPKKSEPKSEKLRDSDDESRDKKEKGEEKPKKKKKKKKKPEQSERLVETEIDDPEFDAAGAGKALGLLAIGLVLGLAIGFALGRMTAGDGGDDKKGTDVEAAGDTKDPFGLGKVD